MTTLKNQMQDSRKQKFTLDLKIDTRTKKNKARSCKELKIESIRTMEIKLKEQ